MKKIVFTGGGTLGHIYPMLPVMEKLKELNPEIKIVFIGSKMGLENKLLKEYPFIDQHYSLDIQGLSRKLTFKNFKTIYKYFKSSQTAKEILRKEAPDIVVGMGGYVSGPVVKSASKLKIKTVIHEQNSVLGLANKFLLNKVDLVLLSYPMDLNHENTLLIGNPRSSFFFDKSQLIKNKPRDYKTILVVGGSRGAKVLNDTFIKLSAHLKQKDIKTILITGEKYYSENQDKIKKVSNDFFTIIPFSNNIMDLFINADLVISRSGATTISELMALKKIVLFIPSPNVTNNHQYKNAKILEDSMAASILKEEDINSYNLLEKIENLLFNLKLREKMIRKIEKFQYLDARDRFIESIVSLYNNK